MEYNACRTSAQVSNARRPRTALQCPRRTTRTQPHYRDSRIIEVARRSKGTSNTTLNKRAALGYSNAQETVWTTRNASCAQSQQRGKG